MGAFGARLEGKTAGAVGIGKAAVSDDVSIVQLRIQTSRERVRVSMGWAVSESSRTEGFRCFRGAQGNRIPLGVLCAILRGSCLLQNTIGVATNCRVSEK